jgi:hypothetical protein
MGTGRPSGIKTRDARVLFRIWNGMSSAMVNGGLKNGGKLLLGWPP